MNQHTIALVGALGGSVLEVLGGVVGTWFSIRNTKGPRERAFVLRAAVVCWLAVTLFVVALYFTPLLYRSLLWLPYLFGLPFALRAWNRRQEQLHKEESGPADSRDNL